MIGTMSRQATKLAQSLRDLADAIKEWASRVVSPDAPREHPDFTLTREEAAAGPRVALPLMNKPKPAAYLYSEGVRLGKIERLCLWDRWTKIDKSDRRTVGFFVRLSFPETSAAIRSRLRNHENYTIRIARRDVVKFAATLKHFSYRSFSKKGASLWFGHATEPL
jgi:hypothetical protein